MKDAFKIIIFIPANYTSQRIFIYVRTVQHKTHNISYAPKDKKI